MWPVSPLTPLPPTAGLPEKSSFPEKITHATQYYPNLGSCADPCPEEQHPLSSLALRSPVCQIKDCVQNSSDLASSGLLFCLCIGGFTYWFICLGLVSVFHLFALKERGETRVRERDTHTERMPWNLCGNQNTAYRVHPLLLPRGFQGPNPGLVASAFVP